MARCSDGGSIAFDSRVGSSDVPGDPVERECSKRTPRVDGLATPRCANLDYSALWGVIGAYCRNSVIAHRQIATQQLLRLYAGKGPTILLRGADREPPDLPRYRHRLWARSSHSSSPIDRLCRGSIPTSLGSTWVPRRVQRRACVDRPSHNLRPYRVSGRDRPPPPIDARRSLPVLVPAQDYRSRATEPT